MVRAALLYLSNIVFASEVFTDVALIDNDDLRGIYVTALLSCLHADTEAERNIRKRQYDDTDVTGRVFGDSRKMTLQNVVAIEESLLTVGLHPDLILGVFSEIVEARDVT